MKIKLVLVVTGMPNNTFVEQKKNGIKSLLMESKPSGAEGIF